MTRYRLSQDSNILRKHVIDGEGRHGVGFILEHVLSYDAEIHQMKEGTSWIDLFTWYRTRFLPRRTL